MEVKSTLVAVITIHMLILCCQSHPRGGSFGIGPKHQMLPSSYSLSLPAAGVSTSSSRGIKSPPSPIATIIRNNKEKEIDKTSSYFQDPLVDEYFENGEYEEKKKGDVEEKEKYLGEYFLGKILKKLDESNLNVEDMPSEQLLGIVQNVLGVSAHKLGLIGMEDEERMNSRSSRRNRNRISHQMEMFEKLLKTYKEQLKGHDKRGRGPQLSVVSPLDVLRQRLLLEMYRRKIKENEDQIQANREILKNLGKRSIPEADLDNF